MSTATYTCDLDYTLIGVTSRTCDSDGMWSDSPPTCESKLVISNLYTKAAGISPIVEALYIKE